MTQKGLPIPLVIIAIFATIMATWSAIDTGDGFSAGMGLVFFMVIATMVYALFFGHSRETVT